MRIGWIVPLVLWGCSDPAPVDPPPDNPLHAELQQALHAFDAGSPGTLLAVSSPDVGTFFGAAGLSDVGTDRQMEPDEIFFIASLTKSFTAAVVLQLRDEGMLELDDTLALRCPSCGFGDKTIDQLLRHQSGISDVVRERIEQLDGIGEEHTVEELLSDAVDMGVTDFSYSNTNYLLLGLVIEEVTASTWETEVRERLLIPLGLDETYLPTVDDLPDTARGYFELGEIQIDATDAVHPSIGWSAGSMAASPENVLRWVRELTYGDAVSPSVHAAMTDGEGQYGRGLYVRDTALGPDTKIGHDGLTTFTSNAFCIPETDTCVIGVANQFETDAAGVADVAWNLLLE